MNKSRTLMNKPIALNRQLIFMAGFFIMALAACFVLLLPATQNSIILLREFLAQRPLNHPVLQARFTAWGTCGIILLFAFYFPFLLKHIFPHSISARALVNIYVIFVMAIAVAPIIYFGQDAIITIHDNLDAYTPWLKMLKDNGLLFALDSPVKCLGNMSTAYFSAIPYALNLLPCVPFDVFTAHIINYVIKIVIGYASMFLLLRHLFSGEEHAFIIKLVSLSFALLPAGPTFWVAMDSVPLLCYCFCIIKELTSAKIDKRVFSLVFFPILSSFPYVGFFLLCLWASGTVAVWFYKKKLNWNLVSGLASLTVGYILVDLKLFYAMFVLREPLNRVLVNQYKIPFMEALKTAPADFLYGHSHSHGPIVASKLIFPTVFLTLLVVFIFHKISKSAYEKKHEDSARYIFTALILLGMSVLFSLMGTFYNSRPAVDFVNTLLPFLKGFNWGRFSFLNRTVLYVLFALTLITLSRFWKMRYFAYIIACLQIVIVLFSTNIYNYFNINFKKIGRISRGDITYNEFFSESLFSEIKADLKYANEGAAALGYHPSVLMYNGFSTIDGYHNSYPLKYALAFREIIAPQLELNAEHKKYYDSWAGRMYLYNDEVGYWPTRDRADAPVTLHINTEAFRRLGGTYIFSRAEIGNAEDLRLKYMRKYSNDHSIYEIFVYKVDF